MRKRKGDSSRRPSTATIAYEISAVIGVRYYRASRQTAKGKKKKKKQKRGAQPAAPPAVAAEVSEVPGEVWHPGDVRREFYIRWAGIDPETKQPYSDSWQPEKNVSLDVKQKYLYGYIAMGQPIVGGIVRGAAGLRIPQGNRARMFLAGFLSSNA